MRFSYILFSILCYSSHSTAFQITDLPPGTPVTLTSSTQIHIPIRHRARFQATHRPQTLRFSTQSKHKIKIAIYNPHQERVHYLTTDKQHPVLYQLQNLGYIDIIPQEVQGASQKKALYVTSDRPLKISH